MNTLASAILSALQDTRDAGYTIEERAEAIVVAVRRHRRTSEPNAIALLREGVFVPNAVDCDHILAAYDAIVAERDEAIAAVREAYREGWVTAAERGDLDEYGEYTHHQTLEPEDFLHSRTADVIRRVMP
jgi:hypothetical protein